MALGVQLPADTVPPTSGEVSTASWASVRSSAVGASPARDSPPWKASEICVPLPAVQLAPSITTVVLKQPPAPTAPVLPAQPLLVKPAGQSVHVDVPGAQVLLPPDSAPA